VLAAGLGLRMRPLTDHCPKPLIKVSGKAIIDYGFGHLKDFGIANYVVNVHYLPDQIEAWANAQSGSHIHISSEREELLDTGGGIVKALPHLGTEPFFVINSDSFWINNGAPALDRLQAAWNGDTMDCLLLVCPLDRTVGYDGHGDFELAGDGTIGRRKGGAALVYAGCYLVHPRLFQDAPQGKFSMNLLWDRAIRTRRLHGLAHRGKWFHVGTPEAIGLAEAELKKI
jgi:N-acetyl-alpha-D-muramate 1-phosphate uridylyltransferase